ncbi:hypothetical protein KSP39_PZI021436 [Platanthera zijinensis]|uniref:CRIB domain-containing protein n=1 Tax=Platanthera zijinensis TaxID=2320716 RepID=A0AAP0FVE9_9ASPA
MAPKVKGLFKGLKCIAHIFVYKDQELEIGYPSDVRHVTHIGWDSASSNAPSWMSQFKSSSDLSIPPSFNGFEHSTGTSWASPGMFLSPLTSCIIFIERHFFAVY